MMSWLRRLACSRQRDCLARLLVLAFFLYFGFIAQAESVGSVCFKETCFQPEIVRTPAEKQRGLMERVRLMPGQGMLFVYEQETSPVFWMKNMRIPLDFVWLDEKYRVVHLNQNVPICRIESCPTISISEPVQYVLEVAAGSIEKSKIKIGDQAIIKLGETNAD